MLFKALWERGGWMNLLLCKDCIEIVSNTSHSISPTEKAENKAPW
jgi:hypothetical protein